MIINQKLFRLIPLGIWGMIKTISPMRLRINVIYIKYQQLIGYKKTYLLTSRKLVLPVHSTHTSTDEKETFIIKMLRLHVI